MVTTEQEVCPTCKGTGRIARKVGLAFPIGSKVLWKVNGYGYQGGIPSEVVGHSKSGKRVKIKFAVRNHTGEPTGRNWLCMVTPVNLEVRSE